MKFTQVTKEQVEQAGEALDAIIKLKRALAQQRLTNKSFVKDFIGSRLSFAKLT